MIKTVSYTHTNSYETLNELTSSTRNIWVCFHGLGYLSKYFKNYFKELPASENYILIPQAPSKFYLDKSFKNVGASWLTRIDTDQEMQNNLAYIKEILSNEHVLTDHRLIFFGYSQGVSIATRVLKHHNTPVKAVIMHSGSIPAELTSQDGTHFSSICSRFIHISGTKDEYSNEKVIQREMDKVTMLFGTSCEMHRPDIKHVVHVPLLNEIAKTL
jgi:predicted esterase